MKQLKLKKLLLSAILLASSIPLFAFEAPNAIFESGLESIGKNAVLDFAANLGATNNKNIKILPLDKWQSGNSIIFGIPQKGGKLENYIAKTKLLKNDGYLIEKKGDTLLVLSNTQEGLANGAYALLRQLGVGLNLGTSFAPEKLEEPKSLSQSPALKIRGFLPWYNFLNSPTTWDDCDHRAFVDDAVRIGANFIGFHTYDAEPLAAFKGDDGNMKMGQRLLSTSGRLWGTHPMKTEDFGFGLGKLYDKTYYGTSVTSEIENPNEAILAEQKMVREAFNYAKSRGVKTCIGFEIRRNPLDESEIKTFIRRLENVIETYPAADYIWLWQPEVWGATGFEHSEHKIGDYTNSLKFYARGMRDVFKRVVEHKHILSEFDRGGEVGKQNRAMEGVRLAQYALVAHAVLNRYENPPKLVISGWGGDRRLISAEYYEGLDKLLPKDVIFSSLDLIGPIPRVDEIYNELPADRERWPIPWLENDGDQWQPQPYVKIYAGLMDKLLAGGSQGVLGIHWRTRCIGENFQYLCDRAWNPSLTLDKFYEDYAASLYGKERAKELGAIHKELDALPYRWVGGDGQVECAIFWWGNVGSEDLKNKLADIRAKLAEIKLENPSAKANLNWLLARIDWVLAYREMNALAKKAEKFINEKNYDEALRTLEDPAFERGFRAYAPRLSTRGEYGVLATVATKAYYWWLENYELCKKNSKLKATNPHEKDWLASETKILLPRRFTSVEENSDLILNPIVLGGGDAWLFYKSLGDKNWKSKKLAPTRGWVYESKIAKEEIDNKPLLFTLSKSPRFSEADFPIHVVSVMPKAAEASRKKAELKFGEGKIRLKAKPGGTSPIELTWSEVKNADYYRVLRDGKVLCSTAFTKLPDAVNKPECRYKIEAVADSKTIASSDEIKVEMPNTPIDEAPIANVQSRNCAGVFIEIAPPKDMAVAKCAIFRKGKPAKSENKDKIFEHIQKARDYSKFERIGEIQMQSDKASSFIDSAPYGDYEYKFVFLNACDMESKNSTSAKISHKPRKVDCALDLPLTKKPEAANVVGEVKFTPGGAEVSEGRLELDFKTSFDKGFALNVDFMPSKLDGMPVIASNGTHMSSGWYVQILGGNLIVSLGKNISANVRPEVGKWYNLKVLFDGRRAKIYVNSKLTNDVELDEPPQDSKPNLKIGAYENTGDLSFKFKGLIKNLKIWQGVPADFSN